ncbi:MAG: molybdate ABC transporter permease subunit [Candidatus Latescibacteria bacterium]|nr:molybdate ABC transporter permease subunit [Candidatus Latescibacterota bacterium]
MMLTTEEWDILTLSLRVGLLCVAISLPFGIALGWFLARHHFRGKILFDSILHLPLVLPPVVTGYVLLILLGRRGILGEILNNWFGIQLAFTWYAAVLASAVVGFPLLLRAIRLAIENIDPKLEHAARTLGASPLHVFITVTMRLAMPGIWVGALLTFARSLGEFGATITFAANIAGETRTLPLAIYTFLNQPSGEDPAMRLVIISALISLGALIASEWVTRRLSKV